MEGQSAGLCYPGHDVIVYITVIKSPHGAPNIYPV